MARIVSFEEDEGRHSRMHPTTVVCRYRRVHTEDGTLLQLDTSGSEVRQIPGKVSQSLQLDEEHAKQLISIVAKVFPSARTRLQ